MMANGIQLSSVNPESCISYLEQDHIAKYADVKLMSTIDGESVFVNRIMLASLSKIFLQEDQLMCEEDDQILILCEYPKDVLSIVESVVSGKYFLNKGNLSISILKELKSSFGLDVNLIESKTSTSFKFDIKKETSPEPSFELEDLKEDIEHYPEDIEFNDDADSCDNEKPKKSDGKSKKPRKRARKSTSDDKLSNRGDKKAQGLIPIYVEGFVRFPPALPSMQQFKIKTDKLRAFQEKNKDQIKVGSLPQIDRAGLLAFELPKPIESYLKSGQSKYIAPMGKNEWKFVCSDCPSRCRTEASLKKHMKKYHSSKYICPIENCSEFFSTKLWYNFIRHMYEHTLVDESNMNMYECICCGYGSDVQDRITRHQEANGRWHNNECTQCCQKFSSHSEYQRHVKKEHQGKWTYRCGHCCEIFDDKEQKGKHINENHRNYKKNQTKVICDMCGFVATHEALLRKHMGSQKCVKGKVVLHCDECSFQTNWAVSLNTHKRTVHSKTPCTFCGKLISQACMKIHVNTFHVEEKKKPFVCKTCGKGFSLKKRFQEHNNIHTGERPYQCDLCEKTFNSSGNMYMHRRSAHFGYKRTK